jgi:hypothetical protein
LSANKEQNTGPDDIVIFKVCALVPYTATFMNVKKMPLWAKVAHFMMIVDIT